jgi:hypothetical protein
MNPNETRQSDMEDMEESGEVQTCPSCGMEKAEWSNPKQGFVKEEETYCCQGCAEGTGCTCSEDEKSESRQPAQVRSKRK